MDKKHAELLINLKVAKAVGEILGKKNLRLKARIEGIEAYTTHSKIEITAEVRQYLDKEVSEVTALSKDLLVEYTEFSEWTRQNLPEQFHLVLTDNL